MIQHEIIHVRILTTQLRSLHWRIIARWSSVFPGIVHLDDFVWLMFVHEHFSAREQTLNTQKHLSGLNKGKHEIKEQ